MHKIYSIIRCFVLIAFSLNGLKADLILSEENIQIIKNLSKKESFREDDIKKCFSLFGLRDEEDRYSQTAKEIKQILERGKTDVLEYEILANLQKILAKFLVYDIQHLSIQPVDVDLAESCFQTFNNVLENQAKILVRNTFYKKKEDFFKDFIEKYKKEIVSLSKNEEFNENLAKQCFRLFVNKGVDDFTDDQVYKSCINVLIGLIGLSKQSTVLLPLQQILKNLLVFYMQQFDELSIKSFYCKFKNLVQGVLGLFPEDYKSELKECFYKLLTDSRRVELTPREEIDTFDKLDKGIYKSKGDCAFALHHFGCVKENLKLLRSASVYLDRFSALKDDPLNRFVFFSIRKESREVVVPEVHYFLSLESMENKNVDLTAFSICLYNKKSIFWDNEKDEEISLYPQIEDNKFNFLAGIKVSMLGRLDALRVLSSKVLEPSLNILINKDLFQVKEQKFLENGKKDEKSIALNLSPRSLKNMFYGLLWKSCLKEKNAEVQHVLTNYSLGQSGIGNKFLYIKDSISPEKQEQQLEIRVHVFATDELLFKALQNFVSQQERQFSEPMFLDYNEKKECFELLDVDRFQRKKKAIYGKLDEKYMLLKQGSKNIVNREKIDELVGKLLKQRDSDTDELDVAMIYEMESLLQEEEQRLEREWKEKAELRRQQEEVERIRKAEEERRRLEEEQRRLAEQQRLEEEARRPRGVYGQQIFDYIERTGTPKKKNYAANARNRNVIVPATLYTDPNQLPPKYRQYFSIIMSEQN